MGLNLVITGAGGFIGRACVDAALDRGHNVRALVRRELAAFPANVECLPCDLASDPVTLKSALIGADAVIHAAATMDSDPRKAARDTVSATTNLLTAMSEQAPQARLVLLSSISVYDADATDISEDTPIDPDPDSRDSYARSKIAQEALLDGSALETWIARPGAVFGPGRIWNAHLGYRLGPLFLRLGNGADIPLIGIGPCAKALVSAAETPVPGGSSRAVNLVESDLPDAARYLAALGPAAPRLQLPVPWRLLAGIGRILGLLPGLRSHLPGLLQPRTLCARFGRKHYSSIRAQTELRWPDPQPLETALRAAVETRQ